MISVSSHSSRLIRFAGVAVAGFTALSLAACDSSNKSSPTSGSPGGTSTTTVSAPVNGQAQVSGRVTSVTGNAAQVAAQGGNSTVDVTPTTKVTEVTPAALNDVTAGSCITVWPTKGESRGSQSITAASVRVHDAAMGKCPQGRAPAPGSATAAPSGEPRKPPANANVLRGTVTSLAGNTIDVTSTDAAGNTMRTAVTVDGGTQYTKQAPADIAAIAVGKCVTAKGTNEGNGVLQAATIDLSPQSPNCP